MSTKLQEKLNSSSLVPNNLFDLLKKYKIIIPALQRHYVQGENNAKAKEVRENFIKDIFKLVNEDKELKHAKEKKELILDFIYGPIDTEGSDSFIPVDGQQRLTTIWLFTRFFCEYLDESSKSNLLTILNRFSYTGRLHATRFCHELTTNSWDKEKLPSVAIKQSSWFNLYWLKDTTVSSMLNTLDTIHENYKTHEHLGYEECLEFIIEKCKFNLCTENFSDDIYMKMNARGLTLTQWENFKGKFSETYKNIADWNEKVEEASEQFYSKKEQLPDNAFFSYLARIFIYLYNGDSIGNNIKQLGSCTTVEKTLPYIPFDEFKNCFDNIEEKAKVIETFFKIVAFASNSSMQTPYWSENYFFDTVFFPKNKNDLDYGLIIFEYFHKNNEEITDFELSNRYIWNILENVNSEQRLDNFKIIIKENGTNLYSIPNSFDALQYKEENLKIELYKNNDKELIFAMQEAEKYMHGRVRIALMNIEKQELANSDLIKNRLGKLNIKIKNWLDDEISPHSKRIEILLEVVKNHNYKLIDSFNFNRSIDNLRQILSTRDDAILQKSYLDGYDPEIFHQGTNKHLRDWRTSIIKLVSLNNKAFGCNVKRHSGILYLYQTSNIRSAIPINDYRFDIFINDNVDITTEFGHLFGETELIMNDSNTFSRPRIISSSKKQYWLYLHDNHANIATIINKNWRSVESILYENDTLIFLQKVQQMVNVFKDKIEKNLYDEALNVGN